MGKEPKFRLGDLDSQIKFAERNEGLPQLLNCLNDLTQFVLNAPEPQSTADHLIIEFGSIITEDLGEIVTLCYNGFTNGAMKILRGMFERSVTLLHIDKFPDEAEAFENYHYIDLYKMAVELNAIHPGEYLTKEQFDEIKAKRDEVKGNYLVKCECRKDCPEQRINVSWSKLGLVQMAKALGFRGDLLVFSYYMGIKETHPKMGAIYDRLDVRYGDSKKAGEKGVFGIALYLMIEVVRAIKERFKLHEIEEPYQECISLVKEMYTPPSSGFSNVP